MNPGGLARTPPMRKNYSPKELAAALNEAGVPYSERWVMTQCAEGHIATLPAFVGRHVIPESELFRLLGLKDQAEPEAQR